MKLVFRFLHFHLLTFLYEQKIVSFSNYSMAFPSRRVSKSLWLSTKDSKTFSQPSLASKFLFPFIFTNWLKKCSLCTGRKLTNVRKLKMQKRVCGISTLKAVHLIPIAFLLFSPVFLIVVQPMKENFLLPMHFRYQIFMSSNEIACNFALTESSFLSEIILRKSTSSGFPWGCEKYFCDVESF